jgi:hypothetical protein
MNEYAQYGILGLTIIGLIAALNILWKKLEDKEREYAKERQEDRDRHLEQFKRLFEDNKDLTETYSKDSREMGIILKEFEMLLKQQRN